MTVRDALKINNTESKNTKNNEIKVKKPPSDTLKAVFLVGMPACLYAASG